MKNVINKYKETLKDKKGKMVFLNNSIDKINKNWNDFSVSISGEFYLEKINFLCKRIKNSDFEMF